MVRKRLVFWGPRRAMASQRALYNIVKSTLPHGTPYACGPSATLLAHSFSAFLPTV